MPGRWSVRAHRDVGGRQRPAVERGLGGGDPHHLGVLGGHQQPLHDAPALAQQRRGRRRAAPQRREEDGAIPPAAENRRPRGVDRHAVDGVGVGAEDLPPKKGATGVASGVRITRDDHSPQSDAAQIAPARSAARPGAKCGRCDRSRTRAAACHLRTARGRAPARKRGGRWGGASPRQPSPRIIRAEGELRCALTPPPPPPPLARAPPARPPAHARAAPLDSREARAAAPRATVLEPPPSGARTTPRLASACRRSRGCARARVRLWCQLAVAGRGCRRGPEIGAPRRCALAA